MSDVVRDYELFNSIMKTHTESEKENTAEMCKDCPKKKDRRIGCSCCEAMPCEIHPDDLKEVTEESIGNLIRSGLVAIDYWEGDTAEEDEYFDIPYLRMRATNDHFPVCRSWGGACAALVDGEGCQIPFYHRPKYGRIGTCNDWKENGISGKLESAKAWRPYRDLLEKIVSELYS